jgi:N-methylhydantoinase A
VTDANVVVGHLPASLIGGEMTLDVEAAHNAVKTIGDAMNLGSTENAAEGMLAIVNENMAGALRVVSVQRGHDPRDFALVAYGGAGPLHANAVAEIIGSFPVLIPPAPGLLCALGDLVADFRDEFARTYIRVIEEADPADVARILEELGGRAKKWLDDESIPQEAGRVTFNADMRYHGQGYEIPVAVDPAEVRASGLGGLDERFNKLHEQLYGFRMPNTRAEIVNLRAVGFGAVEKPELPEGNVGDADAAAAIASEHSIIHKGKKVAAKIYDRARLLPGHEISGPAIVTEFDSTTVILPGYKAVVDKYFNILINKA